jgi:Fic family protein
MSWKLDKLPFEIDVETKPVLKKLTSAHRALAELKGVAQTIPRQDILINSLLIQEAKDSSEVENIVTTHDELYRSNLQLEKAISPAAKEVQNYVSALKKGFELVKTKGVLTSNNIIEIQEILEQNNAGFRKVPGTSLKNQRTGEVIYTGLVAWIKFQSKQTLTFKFYSYCRK